MKKNKLSITEKIQSMTAKEIIMAMVNGLKKPVTQIDMDTFGAVRGAKICFGCAATNTICRIGKYTTADLLKVYGTVIKIDYTPELDTFEDAIDYLRRGDIKNYNECASVGGFAFIKVVPELQLPYLETNFAKDELKSYIKLAKLQ